MNLAKVDTTRLALSVLDCMPKSIRDFFNYSKYGWPAESIIYVAKVYACNMASEEELLEYLYEQEAKRSKNDLVAQRD